MPNATITIERIVPSPKGWDAFTTDAKKLWIPLTKYKSEESNEPFMKSLKIGEPIEVGLSKDGTIIVGPPSSGKDGFKGMTPEERIAERLSITSQTAAKCATELMVAWVAHDGPVDSDTWITWHQIILAAIREGSAVQGTVQGLEQSRGQAAESVGARHGTQGEPAAASLSGRAHETPAPATVPGEKRGPSVLGKAAQASPLSEPTVRGQDPAGKDGQQHERYLVPPPATADLTEGSAPVSEPTYDREQALERAAGPACFGSRVAVLKAARAKWPERNFEGVEQITAPELEILILEKLGVRL